MSVTEEPDSIFTEIVSSGLFLAEELTSVLFIFLKKRLTATTKTIKTTSIILATVAKLLFFLFTLPLFLGLLGVLFVVFLSVGFFSNTFLVAVLLVLSVLPPVVVLALSAVPPIVVLVLSAVPPVVLLVLSAVPPVVLLVLSVVVLVVVFLGTLLFKSFLEKLPLFKLLSFVIIYLH